MAEACPHLHEPSEAASTRLRDPLSWACDSCCSTDGIWCCLRCGHIGCGRRAHLPALGGGHSKHHFHTTHNDNKKKRVKVISFPRRTDRNFVDSESSDEIHNHQRHAVCIDIVTKAVHCYLCDDYVLSDAPWLALLREQLDQIELRRESTSLESTVETTNQHRKEDRVFHDDYEIVEPSDHTCPSNPTDQSQQSTDASPNFEPGITGLVNLGNTCYMNSILQMLSHCSGFRSFFRDFLRAAAPIHLAGEGGFEITRQTTLRLKESLLGDSFSETLAMTEATHALLRVLWSGRWPYIAPRYFVNTVWMHGGLFAARKQQDANEFLNFYLGRVDEELKAPNATTSLMMDLFGVDQYQEVQCDACQTVTKRTEPLLGLMLSLPDRIDGTLDEENSGQEHMDVPLANDDVHLLDCFKTLQTTGRFIGENQFDCDTCRAKKNASWSVALHRRPQSLLISLRRTLWHPEKGVHKDSRHVKFPLELDCSFILAMERGRHSPDEDFEECHYSLKSVVSHSGSSPFVGHYICWCRVDTVDGKKWFLFNDASVTPTAEESVLHAEAFILLYERRAIPSIDEKYMESNVAKI